MGYLRANLSALARIRGVEPRLPEDDGRFTLEATGPAPVLCLSTGTGAIALNSQRDPQREADTVLEGALAGVGAPPPVVTLIGLGLGFVIDAIERRLPGAKIIALEPEPGCVRYLLDRRDLTGPIADGRLLLSWGPDYAGTAEGWRLLNGSDGPPPTLTHPVLCRHALEGFAAARTVVDRMAFGARANAEARRRLAGHYLLNTLRNLPVIARSADTSALFGAFQGVPGVIISAGPSLDESLDDLRGAADRAVLVAVDTALRPLLSAGIEPHLVVSVDPSEANGQHLCALPDAPRTHLVAEGSIEPAAMRGFDERVFTFKVSDHQPWPWLASCGLERPTLRAWGSVATTAFDLALRMGCDPVVFVGQDLAFTGGRRYGSGTTFERNAAGSGETAPNPELQRHGEWLRMSKEAPDINGQPTPTTDTLIAFRDWLVERCGEAPGRRFVNATGAGILMGPAIEQAKLLDAVERENRTVDAERIVMGAASRGRSASHRVEAAAMQVAHAAGSAASARTLAEWRGFAAGMVDDEDIQAALAWLPGTAGFLRRRVKEATQALCRLLALPRVAAGIGRAPGNTQKATEAGLGLSDSCEWSETARDDVAVLERAARLASCFAPIPTDAPSVPFHLTLPPYPQTPPLAVEATAPPAPEAVDWRARRMLVLAWAGLLRMLPAEGDAGFEAEALRLAEWVAALTDSPSASNIGMPSLRLATRLDIPGREPCGFRFDLRTPSWRAMRRLTGAMVPADPTGREGDATETGGAPVLALRLDAPGGSGGRLRCGLELGNISDAAGDPRARFLGQNVVRVRPRVIQLPPSFLAGSVDASTALVTPYLASHSWAVADDGTPSPLPAWPKPIIGEQHGPGDWNVAWSNVGSPYLMRRAADADAVETVACPFRPGRVVVLPDGTTYCTATTGGLWRWGTDGSLARVAASPPVAGLWRDGDRLNLDPVALEAAGPARCLILAKGWTWHPHRDGLTDRDLEDVGQASCRSESGGAWAAAHPAADLVRVCTPEGVRFDIGCDWPNDVAWAGGTLVVTTAYGVVLMFEQIRKLLTDAT